MGINNYVWENDLSLNDLVLKQKEEIERFIQTLSENLGVLEDEINKIVDGVDKGE